MKKLLIAAALVALVGFGCAKAPGATNSSETSDGPTSYENAQYGFSLTIPKGVEMRDRLESTRKGTYLGMDVDYFASLRDLVRDAKPTGLASFYAVPPMTPEAFATVLEASNANGAVKVTSSEDVTVNGVSMRKVVSTTEMGTDKVHYLFDAKGATIIVSQILSEETEFDPIFATIAVK